jgi:molybdopterin synthase sulfur carrier subunit
VNVQVRLFAAARHAAGRDRIELEVAEGATVGQLRRRMAEELPQLAGLLGRATFAVDAEYAADGDPVPPGAEVACIPTVSGG